MDQPVSPEPTDENGDLVVRRSTTVQTQRVQTIQRQLEDITVAALDEAQSILKFGLADQKIQIIRTVLSGSMKILGSDAAEVEQEARVAIDGIWSHMRDINNAGPDPATPSINNSDEGPEDETVPH